MKKVITLIFVLFIINGCTMKLDLDILKKDKVYQNALQYTKRAEIIKELDTKATISVTYLNAVDFETYQNDEYGNEIYYHTYEILKNKNLKLSAVGTYKRNTFFITSALNEISHKRPQAIIMASTSKVSALFIQKYRKSLYYYMY